MLTETDRRIAREFQRRLAALVPILDLRVFGSRARGDLCHFYALLALLATRGLGTSKHSGALALFDREFVKTGVFPRDFSRSLRLAFDRRQTHDYGEMVQVSRQILAQRQGRLCLLTRALPPRSA